MKHRRPLRPRPRRGFSLVELLIGMTIFTTSFLMILGIFPTSARSIHQARTILLGTHVAQQLMEQYVTTQPFDRVVGHMSGTTSPWNTTVTDTAVPVISMVNGSQEIIQFNWQIQVFETIVDHARDIRLKSVRLQVYWSDTEQTSTTPQVRYVNLETQVTNP